MLNAFFTPAPLSTPLDIPILQTPKPTKDALYQPKERQNYTIAILLRKTNAENTKHLAHSRYARSRGVLCILAARLCHRELEAYLPQLAPGYLAHKCLEEVP